MVKRFRGVLLDDLAKIINQRAIPGTLIFDLNNRLLFSNKEALSLLPKETSEIPQEIVYLCERVKGKPSSKDLNESPDQNGIILKNETGIRLSARAFLVKRQMGEGEVSHIMVLLERVVERRTIQFGEVAEKYQLSKREIEVVRMIFKGCTNREIGEKLYICEYTVKDHIKHIMRKMEVASRNELVAALL
jgi:DNA-binding CsgD family transcriptional regulator